MSKISTGEYGLEAIRLSDLSDTWHSLILPLVYLLIHELITYSTIEKLGPTREHNAKG
jgi:hypothetical protein